MRVEHKNPIQYYLELEQEILLNQYLGKKIRLTYTGNIFCIATQAKIKKTFGQGYSYKAFISLPECDVCIVRPELCHFSKGTCRDEKWGLQNCFQDHYVYLSLTSNLKIGITRKVNTPTRWIDQGAIRALPILKVKNRLDAGNIESYLSKYFSDKTNWRNMLLNKYDDVNLFDFKMKSLEYLKDFKTPYDILDENELGFEYPVLEYPKKITSIDLEKKGIFEDRLIGIKGQYLIGENGVINLRKYQGYEIIFECL